MQKRFGPSCIRKEQAPCFDRELALRITIQQAQQALGHGRKSGLAYAVGIAAIKELHA